MELAEKRVVVVGLGESGMAAASFLKSKGASVAVSEGSDSPSIQARRDLLESKGILCQTNGHTRDFFEGVGLIVLSPGVDNDSQPVKWAVEMNIPIMGEIELAYRFCQGKIVAISGTNGKSTVTMLIADMLKKGQKKTVICGNIGIPFTSVLSDIDSDTIVVLEVSSFQLERIEHFKPYIAIMLNISQDHLDRYKDYGEYVSAKMRLFMNQDENDIAILNYSEHKLKELKGGVRSKRIYFSRHHMPKEIDGAYVENDQLVVRKEGKYIWLARKEDLSLAGEHNVENSLASGLAAYLLGVDADNIKETLYNFKTLDHRFEMVKIIDGIKFIDDSKATNIDSTRRAVQSSSRGIILIAGGKDKGGDYKVLNKLFKEKVKSLVLIGEAKEKIKNAFSSVVPTSLSGSLEEAVTEARSIAKSGDTVLLSPMCSSFDMFTDYKERGRIFCQAVDQLEKK